MPLVGFYTELSRVHKEAFYPHEYSHFSHAHRDDAILLHQQFQRQGSYRIWNKWFQPHGGILHGHIYIWARLDMFDCAEQ